MDMELDKRNISLYEPILDTGTVHEESLEMIVPDASPDILRIVCASGDAYVKEKNPRDGKLDVNGMVKGCVLYVAEGDSIVRRLEVSMPFTHVFDGGQLTSSSQVCVSVSLQSLEAREINPRKIAVRANIVLFVKAYENTQLEICTDIADAGEYAVQLKKNNVGLYAPIAVKDKSFMINDDVEIPSSRPHFAAMLKHDVKLETNDMKIIGNKAVMKGNAHIKYVYNTRDGEMATCEHELPFSQIIDIEGMNEECDLDVKLCLRGVDLEPQHDMSGDTRFISVNILVDAFAIAYYKGDLETIEDLYSTQHEISAQFENKMIPHFVDHLSKRVAVTESLETGSTVKSVIDLSILLEPANKRREEGGESLVNEATINLMYIGEDDTAYCASRRCSIVCPLGEESGNSYDCNVSTQGENFTTGVGNEIVIRFFADYEITILGSENAVNISRVELNAEEVKDTSNAPSVIIKYINCEQSLWEMAKRYNTTIQEIAAANALENEEVVPSGSMLLIPKIR